MSRVVLVVLRTSEPWLRESIIRCVVKLTVAVAITESRSEKASGFTAFVLPPDVYLSCRSTVACRDPTAISYAMRGDGKRGRGIRGCAGGRGGASGRGGCCDVICQGCHISGGLSAHAKTWWQCFNVKT